MLYDTECVTNVEEEIRSYDATVQGTKPYKVSVEARRYNYGHCTCYLAVVKKSTTSALRYIKPYNGPSVEEVNSLKLCIFHLLALNYNHFAVIIRKAQRLKLFKKVENTIK